MGTNDTSAQLVKVNFPVVTKEHIALGYRYLVIDLSLINDLMEIPKHAINYIEYLLLAFDELLKIDGKRIYNW